MLVLAVHFDEPPSFQLLDVLASLPFRKPNLLGQRLCSRVDLALLSGIATKTTVHELGARRQTTVLADSLRYEYSAETLVRVKPFANLHATLPFSSIRKSASRRALLIKGTSLKELRPAGDWPGGPLTTLAKLRVLVIDGARPAATARTPGT
jgi:hypothetical protein